MQPVQRHSELKDLNFTTGTLGDKLGTTGHAAQNANTAAQMLAHNPYLNPIPSPPVPFPLLPTSMNDDGHMPDVVMVTHDQAKYYVYSRQLMQTAGATAWGGVFATNMPPGSVNFPEDAASTFPLALYLVYGLPCHHLGPSLEAIEATLPALRKS
ncbi:hypothetical protein C8Q80DRAFT_1273760 [Daedaleopsis nitida]|nr:hypothetical protein C8Q80DRAFT_1273760 [Daedaleopsis nitida]